LIHLSYTIDIKFQRVVTVILKISLKIFIENIFKNIYLTIIFYLSDKNWYFLFVMTYRYEKKTLKYPKDTNKYELFFTIKIYWKYF